MSKTLITLALGEPNAAKTRELWEAAAPSIDLVELRLDLMGRFDLADLLRDRPTPVIVTHRPVREGGRYTGDEEARVRVLLEAAELGAEHVDCELDSLHLLPPGRLGATRLIVSSHNFDETPGDFEDRLRRIEDTPCDIAKLVGMARSAADTVRVLGAMSNARKPVIAIAMGATGLPTRLLAAKYGAYLTFAAGGQGTAPGQIDLDSMHRVYRLREIDGDTAVYGCIVQNAVPDLGGVNKAFREAGRNAVVVPLVAGDETPEAVTRAYAGAGFAGFVVSEAREDVVLDAAGNPLGHAATGAEPESLITLLEI